MIYMAEIKSELNFGIDNFGKQSKMTQAQTIAQMIINLFLLKPGQLPSLPHIGMNIRQYMYKFKEDIDVSYIKNQIATQCPDILPYVDMSNMQLILLPYENESILYLFLPLSVSIAENSAISIGFKKNNASNVVTFNYKINNNVNI